jgi:hypothetical protein
MNKRELNYKTLFSKWLLAVVLLLSFFTFPGMVTQTPPKHNPSHTEAAFNAQKQAVKSISYRRAFRQTLPQLNASLFIVAPVIDLANFHGLVAKTCAISYNDRNISRVQKSFSIARKLSPQNKSDEPAIALG